MQKHAWSLVALLLTTTTCTAAPVRDYAMSISGGISLGAYDAGRNWVALESLRNRRIDGQGGTLASVTGASAGAINAFISGLYWCAVDPNSWPSPEDRARPRVLRNPYYDLWTRMTFARLLPDRDGITDAREDAWFDGAGDRLPFPDGATAVSSAPAQDGLLARVNATHGIIALLHDWFREGAFRPGCRIPLGFVVTRVEPLRTQVFGSAKHSVGEQTLYLAIELEVGPHGRPRLRAAPVREADRDVALDADTRYSMEGRNLLLPVVDGAQGRIEFEQLVPVLLASSAFPIAFGRVFIEHCIPAPTTVRAGPPALPNTACDGPGYAADLVRVTADFVDGGIFDNVPLGLALVLGQRAGERTADDRLGFVYIDPGIRRVELATRTSDDTDADTPTYGLLDQGLFVGGAVEVAQAAKRARVLQTVCGIRDPGLAEETREDRTSARELDCRGRAMVMSRRWPITGEMLLHFGAFFDERFARYDYLVGVHDGLRDLARQHDTDTLGLGRLLGVDRDPVAWHFVEWLAALEEDPSAPATDVEPTYAAIWKALRFAATPEPGSVGDSGADLTLLEEADFMLFAAALNSDARAKPWLASNGLLRDAVEHPGRWYAGLARRATGRLLWLEERRKFLRARKMTTEEREAHRAELRDAVVEGGRARPVVDGTQLVNDPFSRWLRGVDCGRILAVEEVEFRIPDARRTAWRACRALAGGGYDGDGARKAVAWADIAAQGLAPPAPGWHWSTTATHRPLLRYLTPFQASGDLIEGRLQAAYLPVYQTTSEARFEFPLGVVLDFDDPNSNRQLAFGASYRVPFRLGFTQDLAFGPRTYYDLDPGARRDRWFTGTELAFGLAGKLRLGVVHRDTPWGSELMLTVGWDDLASLARRYSTAEVRLDDPRRRAR